MWNLLLKILREPTRLKKKLKTYDDDDDDDDDDDLKLSETERKLKEAKADNENPLKQCDTYTDSANSLSLPCAVPQLWLDCPLVRFVLSHFSLSYAPTQHTIILLDYSRIVSSLVFGSIRAKFCRTYFKNFSYSFFKSLHIILSFLHYTFIKISNFHDFFNYFSFFAYNNNHLLSSFIFKICKEILIKNEMQNE